MEAIFSEKPGLFSNWAQKQDIYCCLQLRRLDAHQEALLALHIANEAQCLLDSFPTSSSQDEQELLKIRSSAIFPSAIWAEEEGDGLREPEEGCRRLDPEKRHLHIWFQQRHAELALVYRRERKLLLERLKRDLLGQANLLNPSA